MGTVPWTVTCGHHWAGKQSGLCQDFTPTVPAQRRWAGKRGRGGRPAWPPQAGCGRGPWSRESRLRSHCCHQVKGSRCPGSRSPGSAAPWRGAAFHQDTIQGPQAAQSQALGQKARMSVCWARQPGRASVPAPGPRGGYSGGMFLPRACRPRAARAHPPGRAATPM